MSVLAFRDTESGREDWLAWRHDKIGASDVVAISGLSRYQTPYGLWALKTHRLPRQKETPAMIYGRHAEAGIISLFSALNPDYEVRANKDSYALESREWAIATPDAFVNDDMSVECKHSAIGEGWDEGAPDYAHIQLMWQMGVMGHDKGIVVGLIEGRANDLRQPFFEFDQEVFEQLMYMCERFIQLVQNDTPPPVMAADKHRLDQAYFRRSGTQKLSHAADGFYRELRKNKLLIRNINKKVEKIKERNRLLEAQLRLEMEFSDVGVTPQGKVVTIRRVARAEHKVKPYSYTVTDLT
jgi:putative phage-type endonuclease